MRLIDATYLRKMLMLERHFTFCGESETDFQTVLRAIEECPTIDAKPVVHGYWADERYLYGAITCSICKCKALAESNFCPYCGADMRRQTNDNK